MSDKLCKDMVRGEWLTSPCPNPAKYGDFCGVHHKPKPTGRKLYAVYQGYGDESPHLCEADVIKETKKRIQIKDRGSLAFACRSFIGLGEMARLGVARTPAAAVVLYVRKCDRALGDAMQEADDARMALVEARRLEAETT